MTTTTLAPTKIDLDKITLLSGGHEDREEGVCAMEAVAWFAGEPHSDRPRCTCPVIADFVRQLNDAWDDDTRNCLLKPLLPHLVGTRSTPSVENRRAIALYDWAVRVYTPAFLDLVDATREDAATLRALPEIVDEATARGAAGVLKSTTTTPSDGPGPRASFVTLLPSRPA